MNNEEIKAHVLLARNGDSSSFCKLYELYYKDMYRFAYYILGNEQDAEDVISETVLDAFTGIKNLKQPSKFKSWIFRILAIKCKRQQAAYIKDREHIKQDITESNLIKEDCPYAAMLDVQAAFSALNETEKMIISLMVFAGYTSRETAKILKSTEGTIRSAKSRAFTKMSHYLKEDFA
ncbi:MAG: RNA polymerase sigma factor [Lachnospiraceae bacterium]|nr:RNA polymerase sigma factor [Lachnospiraceae bacterium]MDE6760498.1 RNA polymerase sigma factor [Lachnospiraceae bacterium]